jgi:hypothetical protein
MRTYILDEDAAAFCNLADPARLCAPFVEQLQLQLGGAVHS